MLSSSSIACLSASLGDNGQFNTENILQIADVVELSSWCFCYVLSQQFDNFFLVKRVIKMFWHFVLTTKTTQPRTQVFSVICPIIWYDSDLKGAWHYNHVTFTPIAKIFMLNCRLIYMLSILCVRLTIKVKVGIPESFKVGWYPTQKTGSSHLNFLLFTIDCDPSKTEYSRGKLNCSC